MENKPLAMALACMTMFAMNYDSKNCNDKNRSNNIPKLRKIYKDIADSFPSLSLPSSDDIEHTLEESS